MTKMMTIWIVSGEGEQGTVESFGGRKTALAVIRRLARERIGGDRWAYAVIDGRKCSSLDEILQCLGNGP